MEFAHFGQMLRCKIPSGFCSKNYLQMTVSLNEIDCLQAIIAVRVFLDLHQTDSRKNACKVNATPKWILKPTM